MITYGRGEVSGMGFTVIKGGLGVYLPLCAQPGGGVRLGDELSFVSMQFGSLTWVCCKQPI